MALLRGVRTRQAANMGSPSPSPDDVAAAGVSDDWRVERTGNIETRGRQLAAVPREKAVRVPGVDALIEALKTEQGSGAPLLAGGLAYRLFFWLTAFGLFTAALLSFWVRES